MSVNAVGFNCTNYPVGSSLSDETKRKLMALGIDPSAVMSEAQAQMLISKILKSRQVEQTAENKPICNNIGELDLISKAAHLAKKVGLNLPQGLTLDDMLGAIAHRINSIAIQSENDENNLATVQEYQSELQSISSNYSVIKQNENAIFASMNQNANINKMMLGLQ